ncbi:MAG TPA: ABC transporter substrate-binding protein, partial [Methylomirabilota bacterium]|nr:ABC transporter substrate-binding protein [Methylomirabilota bacterium]
MIVRSVPEVAPRIASLLKGEVDVITQLPPDHGERVSAHPSTRVVGALYAGLYVLAVNSKVRPLDNPLVKQALALAIDRDTIVKELWRGRGIVPNSMIAKGDNHYDGSLPPLKYDPKEARERLKKAGYRNEEIVVETTVGYMANDKPMAEAVAGMWRDVGVNAKVEVLEYSVRAQKNRDKTFKGLWWSDPTSTLGDPDGMMWRLLGPGGPQDYWRHARWDELGEAARFSVDEKFREGAYREMTKIFLEYLPWIPIIQPYEDYGVQKYVEWTPDPLQQLEIRRFNFKFRRT